MRGKFYVQSFIIQDLTLHLTKSQEKRKISFNIAKLLVLQNIIIKQGVVKNADFLFPGQNFLKLTELRLSLSPTLFGTTRLGLSGDDFFYNSQGKKKAELKSFNLEAVTRLARWTQAFPYFNDLKGKLSLTQAWFEQIELDSLSAQLEFKGQKLSLDTLKIIIDEKELEGSLKANLSEETWQTNLNIPKPIYLPYLGKPIKTLETAGEISGSIEAQGTGFNILHGTGQAKIELEHKFAKAKTFPLTIQTQASWRQGIFTINQGQLKAQEGTVLIEGNIDTNKKQLNLKLKGNEFPAEAAFDKFESPYFHKIYGKTNFEGEITGWGKQFKITAQATTNDGGYLPMQVQKVNTKVEAGYDKLFLDWQVFEKDKQTGQAQLTIKFGAKLADQRRHKDLNLSGSLYNHPVEQLLPSFGISGLATGEIKLEGEVMSIQGQAKAKIENGNLVFIPFDLASADLAISRKKLVFDNISFKPHTVKAVSFEEPVQMDMIGGAFNLTGSPTKGLAVEIGYNYERKQWNIKKLNYINPEIPEQKINVEGNLISGGQVNLRADGLLDLGLLAPLGYFFRETAGQAQVNLRASGSIKNPSLDGKAELMECLISPRQVYLPMEQIVGELAFNGHKIFFKDLEGLVEEGKFELTGELEHQFYQIKNIDIKFVGENLTFRSDDGFFRAEFEGNFDLKGNFPSPLLKGDLAILDARYIKDFNILKQATKGTKKQAPVEYIFNPRLDLRVHNTGELLIKNNVGDISLRADVDVGGTRKNSLIGGTVEVIEGELHYMGLNFEITRGFMEFRGPEQAPYLEAVGQKEIEVYNVMVEVFGNVDNLNIELSATSPTGPLEKRDVISLLAFGMTETEREQLEASKGGKFGVSMAAQQLTHIVERPVSKLTHLDTFRLEASETEQIISRVSIGKQLSDRLTLDFTTDINTTNAVQTLEAEYLFTDNLLLKGSRSTDDRYEINGILRFRFR
ncbi:MAG: translocation/assembly module TamB domain-containing protein [Pseudomonadota bacterium]